MREIKFRAWHKKQKKMFEVHCIDLKQGLVDLGTVLDVTIKQSTIVAVNIMSFTGLTDKNGTEIYEGDIIRYTDDATDAPNPSYTKGLITQVVWEKAYWWPIMSNDCKEIEVIGNVYEHPQLLEPKEKE